MLYSLCCIRCVVLLGAVPHLLASTWLARTGLDGGTRLPQGVELTDRKCDNGYSCLHITGAKALALAMFRVRFSVMGSAQADGASLSSV